MQSGSLDFVSMPYSNAESLQFHLTASPNGQNPSGAGGANLVPPHVAVEGPHDHPATAHAVTRDAPHRHESQQPYYEAQRRDAGLSQPRAASASMSVSMPLSARSGAERRTARDHEQRVRTEQEAVQHRATLNSSASLALAHQLASLPAHERVKLGYQLLKERQARTNRTSAIFASTTERLNPHGRGPRKPEVTSAGQGVVVVASHGHATSGMDRSFAASAQSPQASPKSPHSLSLPASPRRVSGNVMVGPAPVTPQAERAIRLELERRAALALKLGLDFDTLRPRNQAPHPTAVGMGVKNAGAPFGRTTGPRGSLRCPDRALAFLAERSEASPAPTRGQSSPSGAAARLTSPMGPAALTRFLASPGPGQYTDPLSFVGA